MMAEAMSELGMPWTGERYVPEVGGQVGLEHLHRYIFACQFVSGKDVLDIACGEGYGSAMLARTAAKVIGVDISDEAIEHARKRYLDSRLTFLTGSCAAIPLPDACIDVVVSFETIEHHAQHKEMISEIKRVLRPNGLLVISCPEKHEYSDIPGYRNPFHVKELYRHEFEALLGSAFANATYFGQRLAYGSAIFPQYQDASIETHSFKEPQTKGEPGLARPQYLLAVASQCPLPHTIASLCEQALDQADIVLGMAAHISALDSQYLSTVNSYEQTAAGLRQSIVQLEGRLHAESAVVRYYRESFSWRVTYPLRVTWRLLLRIRSAGSRLRARAISQTPRGKQLIWGALRALYHRLPLNEQSREGMKSLAYRMLPAVFGRLPSYQYWEQRQRARSRLKFAQKRRVQAEGADSLSAIQLPQSITPLVSVVIPVYGKIDYTLRCLRSIEENPTALPIEVIVVDDCSKDETLHALEAVGGIRVISNCENLGFIKSCNRGAQQASGEYIYFLNNDTEVMEGWLDELVASYREFPDVGLVGSMLLYSDGRLQEAGSVIWRDGSAWNIGRSKDPERPEFNYARQVDYCSGASLLIKKALFDELGGFDEHYLPAYGEDSDLALKVTARGLRVIYQPLSRIVHHEGISSGTDVNHGVKSYQVINARKLLTRWSKELEAHQAPGVDPDVAKDRGILGRALVLDHCTPSPDQDAGSVTSMNLMLLLRQAGYAVTFIPEDNFLYLPKYTPALQRSGIEVLYQPFVASVEAHLREFGERYDMVLVFRPIVARRHLGLIQKYCQRAKLVYHTSDLHFLRMERAAEITGDTNEDAAADEMRALELSVIQAADATIVHSSAEEELLKELVPDANVRVFQWAIPIRGTNSPLAQRRDIVFIGGFQHPPNVDAVIYFLTDIFPLVKAAIPEARFLVVGSNPPPALTEKASDDVVITGFVEDLAPLLDRCRVAVAPLRYGAGIKGKIGTTLSVGLPCVASLVAAEGMGLQDGEDILIADSPEDFAAAVTRIYRDDALWGRISVTGTQFAERNYGRPAGEVIARELFASLGLPCAQPGFLRNLVSPLGGGSLHREDSARARNLPHLSPLAVLHDGGENREAMSSRAALRKTTQVERELLTGPVPGQREFQVAGFCIPCNREVQFQVADALGAVPAEDAQIWTPTWREQLECPHCRMKNRERLVAALVKQYIGAAVPSKPTICFLGEVTPLYEWFTENFANYKIVRSDYLGVRQAGGDQINGVRHEDVTQLNFESGGFDLVVSNDVSEHVPDPAQGFRETMRVLRPGGTLLATRPFSPGNAPTGTRAVLGEPGGEPVSPPAYHGDPVSLDGVLTCSELDWDVLSQIRAAGFEDAAIEVYADPYFGQVGGGQLVFRATKGAHAAAFGSASSSEDASAADAAYASRVSRETDAFTNQVNVHDLPSIFHYWSNTHLRTIFDQAGVSTMERYFAEHLLKGLPSDRTKTARFLSIGAGNCDTEIGVVKELQAMGAQSFVIECLELNPAMLARGRKMADRAGLAKHLAFVKADFNEWRAVGRYDGIMANQSLHHVLRLEHLLDQVSSSLEAHARFVISDIIGCNGHKRWPEALERVNALWKELPDSYKYNHALQRHEKVYENWDCSTEGFEGIRAQDILPLLIERFQFEVFLPFGNVIDIFVDRAFGHNFNPELEADRAFIDRVHAIDEQGFQCGTLKPTHLMAVMSTSQIPKAFVSRGLDPATCVRMTD